VPSPAATVDLVDVPLPGEPLGPGEPFVHALLIIAGGARRRIGRFWTWGCALC
jgi:hypothetical protein